MIECQLHHRKNKYIFNDDDGFRFVPIRLVGFL